MATLRLADTGVTLVVATRAHARELGRVMRDKDRAEIMASGNWTVPEKCVRANMNRSIDCYAAYAGKDLLAVFGVIPFDSKGYRCPWALTTVHVERHPFAYWKASKLIVAFLRSQHEVMLQMIHGQYTQALRWVERLGFKLHPPEKFGPYGDLFCPALLITRQVEVTDV